MTQELLNHRYRILETLGQGAMGQVFLVEDILREGVPLALKTVRADLLTETKLEQFKLEFAALQQLRHPNLVQVFDFGVLDDTGGYYYTMQHVPGRDLSSVAAAHFSQGQPEDSLRWLYDVVVQVCRALHYIHLRGLIHYDVKPVNIRITPEGVVKLMDFGLIGEPNAQGQMAIRGTPEYVAPELIRTDPVDHRVDLYSLGVSLYEIVSGHPPFTGESNIAILRQHLESAPPPLEPLTPNLPDGLRRLILQLLAKDPNQRYENANAVIMAINDLKVGEPYPVETRETLRSYVFTNRLIGREFELDVLNSALERMLQGQGGAILIGGATGIGKTRLAREVRLQAQLRHVLVCETACAESNQRPYGVWGDLLAQAAIPQRENSKVQPYIGTLAAHFSDFEQRVGVYVPLEKEDAPPTFEALLEAAHGVLTAANLPMLLLLEDLHHADGESLALLKAFMPRLVQTSLLLLGLFTQDQLPEDHVLQRLAVDLPTASVLEPQVNQYLHIQAIDQSAIARMVQAMLGISPQTMQTTPELARLPRQLMAETGGNPLFIESVLQNLLESGALQSDGKNWRLKDERLPRLPASLQEALTARLNYLEPSLLDVLRWVAVMGRPMDTAALSTASGVALEQLLAYLAQAARQGILVRGSGDNQSVYQFLNIALRDAVYETVQPAERARRHRVLADTLAQTRPEKQVADRLAWHYEQAGAFDRALHYLKIAAEQAANLYANESAIRRYTRALDLLNQHPELADLEKTYRLLSGREICCDRIGNRSAQLEDLSQMQIIAEELANVPYQVDVLSRQANLFSTIGRQVEARRLAERTLKLASQTNDPALEGKSLLVVGRVFFRLSDYLYAQQSYQAAMERFQQARHTSGEANARLWLGHITRRIGQGEEAYEFYQRALEMFRVLEDRQGECDALNGLGLWANDYAKKRDYHEQSLAIAIAIGARHSQTRSFNNLALIYWGLGLYAKARDYLEQAVIIERQGNGGSLIHYLETLGRVYLDMGDLQKARECFEEGSGMARSAGNRLNEAIQLLGLGRAAFAEGDLKQARELMQHSAEIQRDTGSKGYLAMTLACMGALERAQGRIAEALNNTRAALDALQQAGNAGDFMPQYILWEHYQTLRRSESAETLSEEAKTCLQQAHQLMWSNIATLSDEAMRRSYLNRVAVNQQIITEAARWHLADPTQETQLEVTPSQPIAAKTFDKLKRVLEMSQRMNENHEPAILLNFIVEQIIELTGAERSFVMLVNPEGQLEFQAMRGIAPEDLENIRQQVSSSVLNAVSQSLRPILLQDALTDQRFKRQGSVLDLHLRSLVCVPLLSNGALLGLLYADNRSIGGRFSQGDLDLLSLFANQAATAIENTRLYQQTLRAKQELETWAHTLEQRVDERTNELRQRSLELEYANRNLARLALQLQLSSQVGQRVTTFLNPDELLPQVVQLIQTQFRYYFAGVWLLDETSVKIELKAGTSTRTGLLKRYQLNLTASSIVAGVCRSGRVRLVNDVMQAQDFLYSEELPETRAELVLPIRIGQRVIGALDIHSDKANAFSDNDQMVFQTLADQIAIAIRNAQLYHLQQQRREIAETLARTGREITGTLEMQRVPALILEQLALVVPYERGAVLLRRDNALQMIARRGFPASPNTGALMVAIRPGDVFQQISATRQPVLVEDVTKAPGWQQVDWLPVHHSWLGVPLISKDNVIGMVSLTRKEVGAFTPVDAETVVSFAVQAAIALENAHLVAEIRHLNEHLEKIVQERTEQLKHAYQSLERLDRAKTKFIDVAAHELRTPLTAIHGYSHLLRESKTIKNDPDGRILLDGILRGVNRLQEIINSILDMARIDNQTLQMRRSPVRLAPLYRQLQQEFGAALRERRLTLQIENIDTLPEVSADASLLYKAFQHLLTNAIKYTPDGGKITLSGRETQEENRRVLELRFADTGIGIAPEEQTMIFEKFYQTGEVALHSSGKTKYKGGGPGLGLAIVRGIVLAHGGNVWVESRGYDEEKCPGSTFYVRLPVKE